MKDLSTKLAELHEAYEMGRIRFSPWEGRFIVSVWEHSGGKSTKLSSNQLEKIDEIHAKHFDG